MKVGLPIAVFVAMFHMVTDAQTCGSSEAGFSIAGASSVERLASAWANAYRLECEQADSITVEAGGSTGGAARVCGTSSRHSPVDIGGMTRTFNTGEATSDDGWYFHCQRSPREAIQIDVGWEGISAAVNTDGVAADCLYELQGLTIDQIRWIYSSYSESELLEEGWDPLSIPNSDNDPSTHLWSELNPSCEEKEILIGGPDSSSLGSFAFFSDQVFQGETETFDFDRPDSFLSSTDDTELVQYILENDNAISYFGLAYIMADLDQELVSLVSVLDGEGETVKPSGVSFEDGSWPLARRLYMNVYTGTLELIRPFVDFGYSDAGDVAIKSAGFWPVDDWEKVLMSTRLQTPEGIDIGAITDSCGPQGGVVSIAGSSTVFPVAQIWAAIYGVGCDVEFTVDGGGSSKGASRVCGNLEHGSPVDIGDMSRQWKDSEATRNGFLYSCLEPGDPDKSVIQVDVAIDGLTVAVQEGGAAWRCIQLLNGLTIDQLRWIYSDYNDIKLEETGWDPTSLKNSDHNSQTHLWNELDAGCDRVEIRIAGADNQSGTYEFFLESVFTDHKNGESFDLARPGFGYRNNEDDEVLVAYLQEFGEAISYFGYSYYHANKEALSAVPISNDEGEFVLPNAETVGGGSYNPLARRIYMNLLNDASALADTVPFVKFGLQHVELVADTGYVAIPEADVDHMIRRIEGAPYGRGGSGDDMLSTGAIVGFVIGGVTGLSCLALVAMQLRGGAAKTRYPEQET